MFRSMVLAFATLLAMGQARDKTNVTEPTAEGDRANDLGLMDTIPANWALPRDARKAARAPVSEL